jgi:hypothetical protein
MRAVFEFFESLFSITCRVALVAFGTTEHNEAPLSHAKVTQSDTAFAEPPFQGTTPLLPVGIPKTRRSNCKKRASAEPQS